MATKAELERELAELRRQMQERPEAVAADPVEEPEPGIEPEAVPKGTGNDLIDQFLKEQGVAMEDIREVMDQFNEELGDLPQNKPLLTALGAFAIGFVLGRMSK